MTIGLLTKLFTLNYQENAKTCCLLINGTMPGDSIEIQWQDKKNIRNFN